jgi:hypothetical protein
VLKLKLDLKIKLKYLLFCSSIFSRKNPPKNLFI